MKVISKQNWKYGITTIETTSGETIEVFQNADNNMWYAVIEKNNKLIICEKTKKEVIKYLKSQH